MFSELDEGKCYEGRIRMLATFSISKPIDEINLFKYSLSNKLKYTGSYEFSTIFQWKFKTIVNRYGKYGLTDSPDLM